MNYSYEVILPILAFIGLAKACIFKAEDKTESKRIVGQDVRIDDYPYTLQVMAKQDGKWVFFCGAVMLDDNIAVTASGCVTKDGFRSDFKILGGSATRGSGSHHSLDKIVTHPGCAGKVKDCIAVIRVDPPFPHDFQHRRIYMVRDEPAVGTNALVTGWGKRQYYDDSYSNHLKRAEVKIMTREACQLKIPLLARDEPKRLCTPLDKNQLCSGDAGGPMVVNGKLAGIISHTGLCGKNDHKNEKLDNIPAQYLNIAYYRDWIHDNMEKPRKEVQPSNYYDDGFIDSINHK